MKNVLVTAPKKIKKAIPLIENKIKIKLSVNKNNVCIKGDELTEYAVEKMIEAIDFGFEPEDTFILTNEDFTIGYVNMKEHTHRHNLEEIRSRVIGTQGKAKTTIETLTGSVIVVKNNRVGIIADSEHLPHVIQGIISLIQGSKHGNVFAYLEKQNANLRKLDDEDLGLKDPKKDLENLED